MDIYVSLMFLLYKSLVYLYNGNVTKKDILLVDSDAILKLSKYIN